jgi:glycosyltransferase involved in cell wall biosynthesis
MLEVSVVIPAKNAAETIGQQLEALAAQDTGRSWELVVADNGSTDQTVRVVETFGARFPKLTVLDASGTPGSSHARNAGAARASGRKLLFCDADDVVSTGWLDALAAALDDHDAVGGQLEVHLLNAPETVALSEPLTHPDRLGQGLFKYRTRAVTANFGVRSDVFAKLHGFDPSFPVLVDSEFCLRLQVEGFSLAFVPEAVVHYRYRSSVRAVARQIYMWSVQRPRLYLAFRQHGAPRSWGVRTLAGLLLRSWWLVAGRERRLRWYGKAIRASGRVVGSIRYRTWYV